MEGSFSNNFLIALLSLLTLGNSAFAGRTIPKTNTEFIKRSCSTTMYPHLCYTSLSSHASTIQTSPKLLAHTALSLSLRSTKSASVMMVRLSQHHNMNPIVVSAMKDCVEELGDAVDQLRNSLREMSRLGGSSFSLMINDVQTWVSAALTNDDTCMDGFGDSTTNGNAKYVVRSSVLNIAQMTSNALSLVNSYAEKHG